MSTRTKQLDSIQSFLDASAEAQGVAMNSLSLCALEELHFFLKAELNKEEDTKPKTKAMFVKAVSTFFIPPLTLEAIRVLCEKFPDRVHFIQLSLTPEDLQDFEKSRQLISADHLDIILHKQKVRASPKYEKFIQYVRESSKTPRNPSATNEEVYCKLIQLGLEVKSNLKDDIINTCMLFINKYIPKKSTYIQDRIQALDKLQVKIKKT